MERTAGKSVNKNAEKCWQFTLEEAVEELERLPETAQLTIKDFLYKALYCGEKSFAVLKSSSVESLSACCLLKESMTPEKAIGIFKKKQIISYLDLHGISGFKRNYSTEKLIAWCVENIDNPLSCFPEVGVFQFSENLQKSQRSLYSYILRKYEWDVFYDAEMHRMRYPHGAVAGDLSVVISASHDNISSCCINNSDTYFFPADRITKLLTRYGHNRCLNGFCAQPDEDVQ